MLAFDFNTDINPETISQATFDENLRAIAEDGSDVGFYQCCVSNGPKDKTICVTVKSEYSIGDSEFTTSLNSELDSKLNLISETYERTQKTKENVVKQVVRTRREAEEDLVVDMEEFFNMEAARSSRRHSLADAMAAGYRCLAGGALIIVERVYALTNAESRLTVSTLDADGFLSNLTFELLCEQNVTYAERNASELSMKQTLTAPNGNTTVTYKYYTVHGQLLSMVQVGFPIVFKTQGLPRPPAKTRYLPVPDVLDDDFHWKDNYMLYSQFTERKEELKSQYHQYIYNHPEFVDLVKDFLKRILMEKPEDTLNFAADFFTTFSKRQILPPRLKKT